MCFSKVHTVVVVLFLLYHRFFNGSSRISDRLLSFPSRWGTFDFDQLPFFAGFFCFQENLIVQQEFRPSGVVLVLASDKNIQHRCLTRKKWSHVFEESRTRYMYLKAQFTIIQINLKSNKTR